MNIQIEEKIRPTFSTRTVWCL